VVLTLPEENQTLLIINCAKSWQEILTERVYICPAVGTAFKFHPCRYFGVYHDKKVSHVINIEAVIDVQSDDTTSIRWINGGGREIDYRQRAVDAANRLRPKAEFPVQVFILGYPQTADFKKDSKGGMLGSKVYRDVTSVGVKTAGDLARKLMDKKWSDLE